MSKKLICHVLFPDIKQSHHFVNILEKYNRPNTEYIPIDRLDNTRDNIKIILGDPSCIRSCEKIPESVEWFQSTWAGVDMFLPQLVSKYSSIPFKITRCAIYGRIIGEYILAQLIRKAAQ